MNLKLIKIIDPGNKENERVWIKVIGDDDAGRYMTLNTIELEPGKILSVPKDFFWFPDQEVKIGDSIVLYTKSGVSTKTKNSSGRSTFFYYWGKDGPLWSSKENCVVLLEVSDWQYSTKQS